MNEETIRALTREAQDDTDFNRTVVIDRPQPDGEAFSHPETQNETGFNRTVVIDRPRRRKAGESAALRRITAPFHRKKLEVEDLIGKMDVSDYTSAEPDTSSQLTAPLGNLVELDELMLNEPLIIATQLVIQLPPSA